MAKILELNYDNGKFDVTINGPEIKKIRVDKNTTRALYNVVQNAVQNIINIMLESKK